MRIGFDVSQTGANKAGCGYVAHSLFRHLVEAYPADEWLAYPTWGNRFWDDNWKTSVVEGLPGNVQIAESHPSLAAAEAFWAAPPEDIDAALGQVDLIHSINFFCPPRTGRARLVYTLHDIGFMSNPDWTTEANRIVCFEGVYDAALNADMILSVSDASRDHFLHIFPFYPAERIVTVPLGSRYADRIPVDAPPSLDALSPKDFWLIVGTIEPRKNHEGLLRAYRRLKDTTGTSKPLVIAGGEGWMMSGFRDRVRALGLDTDVLLTGYVSEAELHWLLQNAFALCYPSFWEGFGLPLLEAMSQGTPVIASNVSSMPEVVGDTGLLVPPTDIDALAAAMARLEADPDLARRLGEAGHTRSQLFTWPIAARKTREAYDLAMTMEPIAETYARRAELRAVPSAA